MSSNARPTRPSASGFAPRYRNRKPPALTSKDRIDLAPEPEFANTTFERQLEERKPVYPCGGFTSHSWVEVPPKVLRTERVKSGMGFGVRNAAMDSSWDADRGAGASRRKPEMVVEPLGFTMREANPEAKPLRKSVASSGAYQISRKGEVVTEGRWEN